MDTEALRLMLKGARDSISPEEVGLPPRRDRRGGRAPGLPQEAIDLLTGRSIGTYSKLERGVLPNRSPEYLRDVARVLGLNEQEWVNLYGYARGERPPFHLAAGGPVNIQGQWVKTLEDSPQAAYICDYAGNVLAHNKHAADMFPDRRMPRNTLHFMLFTEQARKETLIDWETAWAPTVAPMLRALRAQYQRSSTLRQLTDMALADPFLGELYWQRQRVPVGLTHPDGDIKPWHHHQLGPGWIKMCVSTPLMAPTTSLFLLDFHPGERPEPIPDTVIDTSGDISGYFPAAA
ncbi:XRE family transcriptional regulator [Streptomyces stramineus]|uniref:Helix-turn-helix transcriptional regulator n=1 Tax=Streptomyces stramineus TaxID=173861 RepID=A0ABP3JJD7_9ACTN